MEQGLAVGVWSGPVISGVIDTSLLMKPYPVKSHYLFSGTSIPYREKFLKE